jgi:vacuolar-type H+-ATPase subunit I/STV1
MGDLLTLISLIVGIISITLAISAFIFSWVTFRNSSKMQMEAQRILDKISEKVDIVADRTSHQLDKVWEYFTALPSSRTKEITEETQEREQALKEELKVEARQEAMAVLSEAGVQKGRIESLLAHVESIINQSTERTKTLIEKENFLQKISDIEFELRNYVKRRFGTSRILEVYELTEMVKGLFEPEILRIVQSLWELRNKVLHQPKEAPPMLTSELRDADRVLSYLRTLNALQ